MKKSRHHRNALSCSLNTHRNYNPFEHDSSNLLRADPSRFSRNMPEFERISSNLDQDKSAAALEIPADRLYDPESSMALG